MPYVNVKVFVSHFFFFGDFFFVLRDLLAALGHDGVWPMAGSLCFTGDHPCVSPINACSERHKTIGGRHSVRHTSVQRATRPVFCCAMLPMPALVSRRLRPADGRDGRSHESAGIGMDLPALLLGSARGHNGWQRAVDVAVQTKDFSH